jgi:hypothetical protein
MGLPPFFSQACAHSASRPARLAQLALGFGLVMGLLLGPASQANALEMAGHRFDSSARVHGAELVLNGAGVRAVAWIKAYAAALYVASKSISVPALLVGSSPRRLELVMLLDAPAQEFSKALRGGLRDNLSGPELAALAASTQALIQQIDAMGRLKKGDVIHLDDAPATGLQLVLNGAAQGPMITDPALFSAVLRIFLGERPVDAKLKAGLLGRP